MALLNPDEARDIVDALIEGGIDTSHRNVLFSFINFKYRSVFPKHDLPRVQFILDIEKMSNTERLANGDVPLLTYLENALPLLVGSPQQEDLIRKFIDDIGHRISGAPRIDIKTVPETKEVIIHTDDTLPYRFMVNGILAAASVCRLDVPSIGNGQQRKLSSGDPMIANGTGWLLTPTLALTNHHVVNARREGEPAASDIDLALQAKGTIALFDSDQDPGVGNKVAATGLEAWDATLDYAILRLPDSGRQPIKVAAKKVDAEKDAIAVNIIQHPNGKPKRFGIRNNLVSGSTDTDLRYFTDTDSGSSGSPVMNDNWEAVALHRGATYVNNVTFQGKTTAYVNVGTHMHEIIEDLKARYPTLALEIAI